MEKEYRNDKILHLFSIKDSIYTEAFLRFLRDNFKKGEHEVATLGIASDSEEQSAGIECFDPSNLKSCRKLAEKINQSRATVVHGIFFTSQLTMVLNLRAKREKLIWMIWGGDLYNWRSRSSGVLSRISDYNQKLLRKKMQGVIVSFLPDEKVFFDEFDGNSKVYYAHYPVGYTKDQLESDHVKKTGNTVNFLVGNSANPCLNHIEVLNNLGALKDQDILIHIPLNYGDRSYGDKVEKHANEVFGTKAICYREKLDIDEYIRLLWQIDVGIFDTERQIALGNIIMLCYMGKKLYFRKNSPLNEYFEKMNVYAGDAGNIKNHTLDELRKNDSIQTEYILSLEYLEQEKIKTQWNSIFSSFKERS